VHVPVRTVARELLAGAAAALMAWPESIWPSARLANREFRDRTRGRLLPFWPRERSANQRTMHRSFFFLAIFARSFGIAGVGVGHARCFVGGRRGRGDAGCGCVDWFLPLRDRLVRWRFRRIATVRVIGRDTFVRDALRTIGQDLRVQRRRRFRLETLPRDFGVLVFVIGFARRAPRLLDVLAYHGHDGVVRHPSLSRTIIVQNVTKP